MPAEGLDWLPDDEMLTDDEIVRLVGIAVDASASTRSGSPAASRCCAAALVDIVAPVRRSCRPRRDLSLTTNGLGLARAAPAAAPRPGSTGSTSAWTPCDPETFNELTLRDRFHDVVAGLAAADAAGLRPVKVNAVLMRGVNDDEAPELLRWCLDRGYELRFIEQMPLDAQHGWDRDKMVTADEILERLASPLRPDAGRGAAGERAGRAVRRRRRPGDGGRHRLGHPPVLRRLRPGPADRRRPGPQLPVRPRGVRPAWRRCARAPPTRSSPTAGAWRDASASEPGHGIDDADFLQPDRPMSRHRRLTGQRCGRPDVLEEPGRRGRRSDSGARRRPLDHAAGRGVYLWSFTARPGRGCRSPCRERWLAGPTAMYGQEDGPAGRTTPS